MPRTRKSTKAKAPSLRRSKANAKIATEMPPANPPARATKQNRILSLLKRKEGASLTEIQEASGWQAHSVRGFLAGTVKKRLGFDLKSQRTPEGERRYWFKA